MKTTLCEFILLTTLAPAAFAGDLGGTWKTWFAGDMPGMANPVSEIGFDLEAKGNRLTGMAYMGAWGVAELSEGKIDGDRFSFAVVRSTPLPGGLPKVQFEGIVVGKELRLTMMDHNARSMNGTKVESMVLTPVSVNASAEDVTGTWKAWFVGRIGDRPKMFTEVILDFKVEGTRLTGSAHMGGWPGDAPISNGRIEAGHFFFTATGRIASSSGLPKFEFEGTIHGREMQVTMLSGGRVTGSPMDGKKLQ